MKQKRVEKYCSIATGARFHLEQYFRADGGWGGGWVFCGRGSRLAALHR